MKLLASQSRQAGHFGHVAGSATVRTPALILPPRGRRESLPNVPRTGASCAGSACEVMTYCDSGPWSSGGHAPSPISGNRVLSLCQMYLEQALAAPGQPANVGNDLLRLGPVVVRRPRALTDQRHEPARAKGRYSKRFRRSGDLHQLLRMQTAHRYDHPSANG